MYNQTNIVINGITYIATGYKDNIITLTNRPEETLKKNLAPNNQANIAEIYNAISDPDPPFTEIPTNIFFKPYNKKAKFKFKPNGGTKRKKTRRKGRKTSKRSRSQRKKSRKYRR